ERQSGSCAATGTEIRKAHRSRSRRCMKRVPVRFFEDPNNRKGSETQRLDPFHARDFAQSLNQSPVDMLIDRYQGDRFASGLTTAQMKGADIDARTAKGGSKPADEARGIFVDDIDHLS